MTSDKGNPKHFAACHFLLIILIFFIFSGISSAVQTVASFPPSIQESFGVHALHQEAEMPRSLRDGEGHQGGQPVARAQRQVSKIVKKMMKIE